MTRHKPRGDDATLFGSAGRPEWEMQLEDERQREAEKTLKLRAARLAAQARPAQSLAASASPAMGSRPGRLGTRGPARKGPVARAAARGSESRS